MGCRPLAHKAIFLQQMDQARFPYIRGTHAPWNLLQMNTINSDRHLPFSNMCRLVRLLSVKITIDRMWRTEFGKLSSAKLISLLIRQTLVPPNFRRLR